MKLTPKLMRQMRKAAETSMRIEGHATQMTPEREVGIAEWMMQAGVKVSEPPIEACSAEAKVAARPIQQDDEA